MLYGVPFSGDPYELEETLSTALAGTQDGGQWLAKLEQALHRAASATPSVSKAVRMRHAAADCALKALYDTGWFVGFGLAFVAYVVGMKVLGKNEEGGPAAATAA